MLPTTLTVFSKNGPWKTDTVSADAVDDWEKVPSFQLMSAAVPDGLILTVNGVRYWKPEIGETVIT
jgi:hypothetical protein